MICNGVPSDPYTNVCGHVGAVVKVIIGCCRIGDGVILILNAVQLLVRQPLLATAASEKAAVFSS